MERKSRARGCLSCSGRGLEIGGPERWDVVFVSDLGVTMGFKRLPLSRLFCVVFLCITPAGSLAQSTPPPQQNGPVNQSPGVLKANTRLVVVDVVATDGKGTPVPDLKIGDFTVLEDGQPQKISVFNFQQPAAAPEAAPPLPSNVFSNVPAFNPTSLNVILLDALNGEFSSRVYAREQLIKFLESGRAIQPVAVYALENHLKLLHDFTTDTKTVVEVIRRYQPHVMNHISTVGAAASPFTQKGDFQTVPRTIETTLTALHFLAQALSAYPGRKNLIWLSEAFPMQLFPDLFPAGSPNTLQALHGVTSTDTPTAFDMLRGPQAALIQSSASLNPSQWAASDYTALIRKVANALMNAQVAVYPIDAAGVGRISRISGLATMRDIAERTGGRTFANQNNLVTSIGDSLDDGSTYYTLAYYPENKNWNGQLRQIDIKTGRSGVKLRYRVGYYALDPGLDSKQENPKKLVEDFSHMLALDSPSSTAILFRAVVASPADNNQKLVINFVIDARTLTFL
jgi:VWFA-related protein